MTSLAVKQKLSLVMNLHGKVWMASLLALKTIQLRIQKWNAAGRFEVPTLIGEPAQTSDGVFSLPHVITEKSEVSEHGAKALVLGGSRADVQQPIGSSALTSKAAFSLPNRAALS